MKTADSWRVAVLAEVVALALPAAEVHRFTGAADWEAPKIYQDRCEVAHQIPLLGKPRSLVVTGKVSADTAWCATTRAVPVPAGAAAYRLSFRLYADCAWIRPRGEGDWTSGLVWRDAAGNLVTNVVLELRVGGGRFHSFVFGGAVPASAHSVSLRFGNDYPSVAKDSQVAVDDISLELLPAGSPVPRTVLPSLLPPAVTVRMLNNQPLGEADTDLRFKFERAAGVAVSRAEVRIDGRRGCVWEPLPSDEVVLKGKGLAAGLHRLEVEMTADDGDCYRARKWFRVGEPSSTPRVTLRDDGMALIGGKPIFPIGIYGICRREFNVFDLNRAFADLRQVGFDFGHSYYVDREEEYYRAASEHGFKLWVEAGKEADGDMAWLLQKGRHEPTIMAWYLADDTSDNTSVQRLLDRADSVRMTDGTRLTCHADAVASDREKSKFADYADCTEVFIPEIYPVYGKDPAEDRACAATVWRDMVRVKADMASRGSRRLGIWPALQHFRGYGSWKARPSAEQLYAMTFAAVVGGANGIVWYTYGGNVASGNYGAVATKDAWTAMTNVVARLAALRPVLVEREVQPAAALTVVEGPAVNHWGGPAVVGLMKRHAGKTYVMAVNLTAERVTARYPLTGTGPATVLWEQRTLAPAPDGYQDVFAPYAVRVLVIRDRVEALRLHSPRGTECGQGG